ncbi:MAG: hypothetical protein JO307_27580 [Bryobacterales bacterium]|nr:hypothetical protein [Bryobacterales bacterium]MBV9401147.1 hypothetical protein [Bryobacterales bacterium]
MIRRIALAFLPFVAFAQTPSVQPPPEVDAALRARATEFFQDFLDGKFRAAMDLVAEDTQEEYFASGKAQIKEFKIREIKYDPGFEHATVNSTVKRVWVIGGKPEEVDVEMPMTWKLEKGKWVWTHERTNSDWLTPMGPSNIDLVKRNADGTVTGVPHNITQDMVDAAAKKILQQTGVDKSTVTLAAGKPSSDKVVFHNGAQGSIHLEVQYPQVPGLDVKLDKVDLNFGEDAVVQVSYEPPSSDSAAPQPAAIQLTVVPFNQPFSIGINFAANN